MKEGGLPSVVHPLPSELPSRQELLSIVRKQSGMLRQSVRDGKDTGTDCQMDMHFWREMLDMFFVRGMAEVKASQDDDMVFFVRLMSLHYSDGGLSKEPAGQPYFVRRWTPQLENVIGDCTWEVDWQRSFYLNMIAHTSYSLTVAICSHEILQSHQHSARSPLTPVYKVTKTVYASPSRVDFQMDSGKGCETVAAYPDICFMVDDYENTFEAVVLMESDHCYCVLLNAQGGAAFPAEKNKHTGNSCSSQLNPEHNLLGEFETSSLPKMTLFSGFVSYDMVRAAFEGGRAKFRGLLNLGSSAARSERLIMRGPGGHGEVEVAVSGLQDQVAQHEKNASPVKSSSRTKMGIGTVVMKAAMAASVAAKQAYVAASSGRKLDSEPLPLRCCLMSLSLPWETLAHDLLFKGVSDQER